jgi:hypothetical protein
MKISFWDYFLSEGMGINVNSKKQDFAGQIISGEKTIETRNTNSLKSYIGKRMGIIRTGSGKAMLLGYATIGEPKIYHNRKEFDLDYDEHLVSPDSKFYIKDNSIKYGYPVYDIEVLNEPVLIKSRGIIARKLDL